MRYRSRGQLVNVPKGQIHQYDRNCSDSVGVISDFVIAWQVGKLESMWDTVTPNWRKVKSEGKMVFNPLIKKTTTYSLYGNSSVHSVLNANSCSSPVKHMTTDYTGPLFTDWVKSSPVYASIPGSEMVSLKKQVATRTWADRQKGKANYFESLAELDKSFAMVGRPLENVHNFIRNFPKGSPRNKVRTFIRGGQTFFVLAASEWLRYRYGISPLISDVKAGLKAAKADYSAAKPIRHASRAKDRVSMTTPSESGITFGPYDSITYLDVRTHELTCKGVFYDNFVPSRWIDLGLTFQNLVGLPWELTKYSFVVDWFTNVGDVIYANVPRVGVEPLGGSFTVTDRQFRVVKLLQYIDTNTDRVTTRSYGDFNTTEQIVVSRSGLPPAALTINTDFRLDHWIRATDALSLITQAMSRMSFTRVKEFT